MSMELLTIFVDLFQNLCNPILFVKYQGKNLSRICTVM